jgi:hypothetical protein
MESLFKNIEPWLLVSSQDKILSTQIEKELSALKPLIYNISYHLLINKVD